MLQKMLDDIKKLSESGSKEAAEQLLSELDKLLQNLHRAAREATLRHIHIALHKKNNVIGFYGGVDLGVNVSHFNSPEQLW